jgi:hypothetical protein
MAHLFGFTPGVMVELDVGQYLAMWEMVKKG